MDEHTAYLLARFNEGCTSADRLRKGLVERGLKVSEAELLTARRFDRPEVMPLLERIAQEAAKRQVAAEDLDME